MHPRLRPRFAGTLVLIAMAAVATPASAQSDKAGAETLLHKAMKLETSRDYDRACPVFEESLRLYASLNTEYFLADCYEHAGKTATAWVDYLEVAEKAHAAGESAKERKARERAAQIEGKVPHLTVRVTDPVPGLKLARDGVEVGRAQWGVPMPVDSGSHAVIASASGYVTATVHADVERDGAEASVTVPALERETAPAPSSVPPPAPLSAPMIPPTESPAPVASTGTPGQGQGHGQRIAGWVVGGAGVVALGVGGVLALTAKSSYDGATGCSASACTDPSGFETRNSARTQGNVATVVLIAGAAAVIGGGVLWLTAPSSASGASGGSAGAVRFGVGPGTAFVSGKF
jgi:hypothetical protein